MLGSFDINTPYGDFTPAGTNLTATGESLVFSNIDASMTIDNMGLGGLVIPEPAGIFLLSTGLVGIAAAVRRRRASGALSAR